VIEYPSYYPVIAMGLNDKLFQGHVEEIVSSFVTFKKSDVSTKLSKSKKYLSVTINIYVQSKEELEKIYLALKNSPKVSMIL
jgi:putative lipoic acid-binding regulatory protein